MINGNPVDLEKTSWVRPWIFSLLFAWRMLSITLATISCIWCGFTRIVSGSARVKDANLRLKIHHGF